jgi:hypothetical protein
LPIETVPALDIEVVMDVAVPPNLTPLSPDENDALAATVIEIDCAAPTNEICGFDALDCTETVADDVTSTPTPLLVVPTYSSPPVPALDAAPDPDSVKPDALIDPEAYRFHEVAVTDAIPKKNVLDVTDANCRLVLPEALSTELPVKDMLSEDTVEKTKFWDPVMDPPLIDTKFPVPAVDVGKLKFTDAADTTELPTMYNLRLVTAAAA